jgi:hypothetical protein
MLRTPTRIIRLFVESQLAITIKTAFKVHALSVWCLLLPFNRIIYYINIGESRMQPVFTPCFECTSNEGLGTCTAMHWDSCELRHYVQTRAESDFVYKLPLGRRGGNSVQSHSHTGDIVHKWPFARRKLHFATCRPDNS